MVLPATELPITCNIYCASGFCLLTCCSGWRSLLHAICPSLTAPHAQPRFLWRPPAACVEGGKHVTRASKNQITSLTQAWAPVTRRFLFILVLLTQTSTVFETTLTIFFLNHPSR
jgi:hypothetical protein